jgi:hypothetical protein
MDDKNNPANGNSYIRHMIYAEKDFIGDTNRLLAYRPTAVQLIEKYWTDPDRRNPDSYKFQHLEGRLVYLIELAKDFYKPGVPKSVAWPIEDIARALGISPVTLYQDKELPVYLNPNNSL